MLQITFIIIPKEQNFIGYMKPPDFGSFSQLLLQKLKIVAFI